jgi:hypothetical protein
MVAVLEEERVFDAARLPTVAVLPVVAALHIDMPTKGDAKGNARALIRAYVWRAFLCDRYTNAAATAAIQDLRGLRSVLRGAAERSKINIFDETQYPMPTADELIRVRWPKSKDIVARGILAASLRAGALDLADGVPISKEHLLLREYHHLFPDSLLIQDGGMGESESYRALNCALITWNTNRSIHAKEPLRYLRERVERGTLGEESIRSRLRSHLVPYDALNVGGYSEIADLEARKKMVRLDFESFLTHLLQCELPID